MEEEWLEKALIAIEDFRKEKGLAKQQKPTDVIIDLDNTYWDKQKALDLGYVEIEEAKRLIEELNKRIVD